MPLEPGGEHYPWSASPLDAWRLVTEPMSGDEARIAAEAITRALPHVRAYPADPRTHLVTALDRRTVELIRDGFAALASTGANVPEHLISDLEEWLELADPLEHPAVPLIEEVLRSAAVRHPLRETLVDDRRVAPHALWICACETMQDAPTWVIYDAPDGGGVGWLRIPDGLDVPDVVDAQSIAGGHTAPEQVLRWLRGEVHWSALNIDGDAEVVEEFERRLRAT